MTLRSDVAGDLRPALEAIRDALADAIDSADPEKVAPLAKTLVETLVRLAALPDAKKVSAVDEIAKRRAARHKAPVPDSAEVKPKRGSGRGRSGSQRGAGT